MQNDPLQRTGEHPEQRGTLFDSTSRLAGERAALSVGSRRQKILTFLQDNGPATLFEIAAHFGWFDHQISGRLTEMAKDGLIERTGERRTKPETQCVADVWRVRQDDQGGRAGKPVVADLGERQGYPQTINIPGEGKFERFPVLNKEDAPGIPYTVHNEAAGLRLSYRVALIECEGCGRPLKLIQSKTDGKDRKVYRCGTPSCNRTWHLHLVHEPGGPELLALVLKTL